MSHLLLLCFGFPSVRALASPADPTCANPVDVAALKDRLRSGRVYQHFDFLSEEEVTALWDEIHRLESDGGFARSGLSNTVQGNSQQFGSQDRTLCPVPWWTDSLAGKQVEGAALVIY